MDLCQFRGAVQLLLTGGMKQASIEDSVVEVIKLEVQKDCDVESLRLCV